VLIVFDLDGTLVDSRRDLADSANALLDTYGAPPLPEPRIVQMVGDGAAQLVRRACTVAGLDPVPDGALERFLAFYDARLLNHTRPYPGTQEMLERAAAKGTLAVLTNKPLAPSRRILESLELLEFFDAVIGGDGPYPRKPDAEGLRSLVAGRPGEAAVLVGDSRVDRETARAAGVAFCFVRYGFGGAGDPPAGELAIDRPLDLEDILDRLDHGPC
jgi:phosphoglycolate phosphatase